MTFNCNGLRVKSFYHQGKVILYWHKQGRFYLGLTRAVPGWEIGKNGKMLRNLVIKVIVYIICYCI